MTLPPNCTLEISSAQHELLVKLYKNEQAGRLSDISPVESECAAGLWWKCCLYFKKDATHPQGEVQLTERGRYIAQQSKLSFTAEELKPYSIQRES